MLPTFIALLGLFFAACAALAERKPD